MKSEKEAEHERNILDMIFSDDRNKLDMSQVDDYKSPWKDKDASTVNDSAYHNSEEYNDEISDLSKQVEVSKEPTTDTHIFNKVRNLSVGTTSVDPSATIVGIIGQGGRGITQGMIQGGTSIISSNVIKDVLTIAKSH